MSKMDNQRAMREAKWARTEAAAAARRPDGKAPATAPVAPATPAPKKRATTKASASTTPTETGALCGHSSMNGRTCTREAGHSEKSHRYS